jgi:hypothetical protein
VSQIGFKHRKNIISLITVNKKSAKKKKREKRRKLFRSVSYLDQQGIHQGELRKVPGHVVFVLPILRSGYVDYLLLTVLWLRSNIYTVTFPFRKSPCYPASIT